MTEPLFKLSMPDGFTSLSRSPGAAHMHSIMLESSREFKKTWRVWAWASVIVWLIGVALLVVLGYHVVTWLTAEEPVQVQCAKAPDPEGCMRVMTGKP